MYDDTVQIEIKMPTKILPEVGPVKLIESNLGLKPRISRTSLSANGPQITVILKPAADWTTMQKPGIDHY